MLDFATSAVAGGWVIKNIFDRKTEKVTKWFFVRFKIFSPSKVMTALASGAELPENVIIDKVEQQSLVSSCGGAIL